MSFSHKSARPLSASLLASKGTARPAQRTGLETQTTGKPRALFEVSAASTLPAETPAKQAPQPNTRQKKSAFTFRMDERRHFRLRLASAHQNRSSQKIMEDALDAYLESHAPQTAGLGCPCFDAAQED